VDHKWSKIFDPVEINFASHRGGEIELRTNDCTQRRSETFAFLIPSA